MHRPAAYATEDLQPITANVRAAALDSPHPALAPIFEKCQFISCRKMTSWRDEYIQALQDRDQRERSDYQKVDDDLISACM